MCVHWQASNGQDRLMRFECAVYPTTLLPRSLTAIIRAYDVEEVHLSLTSGRWDYARWGEPIGHGAPSGGEIYAWLSNYETDTTEYVDNWVELSLADVFATPGQSNTSGLVSPTRLAGCSARA